MVPADERAIEVPVLRLPHNAAAVVGKGLASSHVAEVELLNISDIKEQAVIPQSVIAHELCQGFCLHPVNMHAGCTWLVTGLVPMSSEQPESMDKTPVVSYMMSEHMRDPP